ncbi:FtsX-like permease family protein [Streptomyces sp. 1222.5]|uniref:ABC transporter permease n=1 Tax=unclassified Streptomyces TaxID=2593676 RepID=UPI000894DDE1|nr:MULTISPECIES: FtsX-like permease family protein [unclassified Streptomyces]PKW09788.1 FtsX-like permease family protein [Streptomyces sp. 5112.2]SEC24752.1 FtsX-like permease family protein [Streptomyces sp. 1222.5]
MNVRQWGRDLGMGIRFAFTGGREGWVRMLLTAVGVGLGVALLLLTTSLPNVLTARHRVEEARQDYTFSATPPKKADDTVLLAATDTTWHSRDIRGRLLEPEGSRPPLPPGVNRVPAKGEMVVSPALKELLSSDGAKLLRERIPYRITGTIGDSGLIGSRELAYYAGAEGLVPQSGGVRVERLTAFGDPHPTVEKADPVLILMMLVVFVVLLMPVAVFIAAAVRFGGERRDRRLAALRLVGSDSRMTRRIAAGEALAGALLGLVVGCGFFLAGRQAAGSVEVMGESFFPGYLNPSPVLVALVAVAVPAAAVLVTLLAMRGVVVEPLGVVRAAKPARRRLWWRLLLPLAGLGMLYPMLGKGRSHGDFNQYLVTGGVLLLLVGVTALLPWLVEAVVARLGPGAVSWQLAVRRLQLSSGTAARMVNGIAVAVAGAIALQMLFAGVQSQYTKDTGRDPNRASMEIDLPDRAQVNAAGKEIAATKGVRTSVALSTGYVADKRREPENMADVTVGDCTALREVAHLPSCREGDAFLLNNPQFDGDYVARMHAIVRPGHQLYIDPSAAQDRGLEVPWKVPAGLKKAVYRKDALQQGAAGVLMTPSALPGRAVPSLNGRVFVRLDASVPDAEEYVRTTTAKVDPVADAFTWAATRQSTKYASLRTGLFIGAICVLALIGASLLVSQLEQLRERRKLLSALVAFGTRRRTLGLSVLWQTAVPIALGLLLASAVGLTLGAVLLKMTATPVAVDWASVLSMTGAGAAVVLTVTVLSLPPLLRLMRPEGLRTE